MCGTALGFFGQMCLPDCLPAGPAFFFSRHACVSSFVAKRLRAPASSVYCLVFVRVEPDLFSTVERTRLRVSNKSRNIIVILRERDLRNKDIDGKTSRGSFLIVYFPQEINDRIDFLLTYWQRHLVLKRFQSRFICNGLSWTPLLTTLQHFKAAATFLCQTKIIVFAFWISSINPTTPAITHARACSRLVS